MGAMKHLEMHFAKDAYRFKRTHGRKPPLHDTFSAYCLWKAFNFGTLSGGIILDSCVWGLLGSPPIGGMGKEQLMNVSFASISSSLVSFFGCFTPLGSTTLPSHDPLVPEAIGNSVFIGDSRRARFEHLGNSLPYPAKLMAGSAFRMSPQTIGASPIEGLSPNAATTRVTRGGRRVISRSGGALDIYELYDVAFDPNAQVLISARIADGVSNLVAVSESRLMGERDPLMSMLVGNVPSEDALVPEAEDGQEISVRCHALMRIPLTIDGVTHYLLAKDDAEGASLSPPTAILGNLLPNAIRELDALGAQDFERLGDHVIARDIKQPAEAEGDHETRSIVEYIRSRIDDGLSFRLPAENVGAFLDWFDAAADREVDAMRPLFNLLTRDGRVLSIPEWTRISGSMPFGKYDEPYFTIDETMASRLYGDLRAAFVRGNNGDERKGRLLDRAVRIAFAHYDGAAKKIRDDGRHYIIHPLEIVYHYVIGLGRCDAVGVIAGLFHDLLEDTDADVDEMGAQFDGLLTRAEFDRVVEIVEKDLTENDLFRVVRRLKYKADDGNEYSGRLATKIELIDRSFRRYQEDRDPTGSIVKTIDRLQNAFASSWRGENAIQRRLQIPEIDRWFDFLDAVPEIPPLLRRQLNTLHLYERQLLEWTEPSRSRAKRLPAKPPDTSKPLDPISLASLAGGTLCDPKKLLGLLCRDSELAELYHRPNGEHAHESVYEHTFKVLEEFETQVATRQGAGLGIRNKLMVLRLAVALHDVGKAVNMHRQSEETEKMIRRKFAEWGFSEQDTDLAVAITSGDDFGLVVYWYHNRPASASVDKLEALAAAAGGVDFSTFANMKLLLFLCDGAAYDMARATMHERGDDYRLRIKRDWTPLLTLLEDIRKRTAGKFDPANFITDRSVEQEGHLSRDVMTLRWNGRALGITLPRADGRELKTAQAIEKRLREWFTSRVGVDLDDVPEGELAETKERLLSRAQEAGVDSTVLILKSSSAERLNAMKRWADGVGLKTMAVIPVTLMAPDSPTLMRHHVWLMSGESASQEELTGAFEYLLA